MASIEEQLSGACTVEIAALDEFSKLLGDADATRAFDHVIFDTPTGHTLRAVHLRELAAHGKRTALEPWHADILAVDPVGA